MRDCILTGGDQARRSEPLPTHGCGEHLDGLFDALRVASEVEPTVFDAFGDG